MKMDLYQKVEKVIQEHILEHQEEVFKAKTLRSKLDTARCNQPKDGKSSYWYDYDRNDPNRKNPFQSKTVTSGASSYDPKTGYNYSADAQFQIPDYTELPE